MLPSQASGEDVLHRQNEYLSALYETALGLINRLELVDLLDAIVNRAMRLVDGDFGWLYLVDPDTQELEVKVRAGRFSQYLGPSLHKGEGLAGRVWQTGQPLAVDDYSTWSGRSAKFPRETVYAVVGVPLGSKESVTGVLGISLVEPGRRFGQEEISLLTRFGELATKALDNARHFAAAQRQAQELVVLDKVRTAMAREIDLPGLFRTVVESTAAAFGYRLVSLYLRREGMLFLQHQVGYDQVIDRIPLTKGVMARVVRTGVPAFLPDVRGDSEFLEAVPGIVSEVCVPLFDQGDVVGTLNVETTRDTVLSEADLRLLVALSEQISVAIGRARLYAEARESERKFRAVVENVAEVIFQIDVAGHWSFLNRAWTTITGYAVEDTIGRPACRYIHPEDLTIVQLARECMASGSAPSCCCELRVITEGGATRWVEARAHLMYGANGTPEGVSGTLNDITERKQAQAELQRQRDFALQVMDALGQGLAVLDPEGQIEYVNPALARLLGVSAEALIGRLPEELASRTGHQVLPDVRRRSRVVTATTYELRIARADGGWTDVLATASPRLSGRQVAGYIVLLTDLTDRKRIEEALAEARDQALEASRLKSEFLATVSHEIRTPMNSIIGMNELLLDTLLSSQQRELAQAVQDSAQGLLAIINDVLDFSRIEAGKISFEAVDFEIADLVQSVAALFEVRASAKNLSLSTLVAPEVPPWLRGDPGRLRQVLTNLVGNAVKFTEHGEIAVRVGVEGPAEDGISLRFVVQDTGIGLPAEARPRLFQPFTQVDGSMARTYGGTGLGLAISRQLVELMGGQIGVESQEGVGSTFWFTAHFASVPMEDLEVSLEQEYTGVLAGQRAVSQGEVVLLAEDNPVNQKLAILQLERLGHSVHAVSDGYAAVGAATAPSAAYALVLMDCQMPGLDGFEATRAIRRAEGTGERHLPIIAMTANAMRGDREACLAAGMDDYVSKPVRISDLHQVLTRWLRAPEGDRAEPADVLADRARAPSGGQDSAIDQADGSFDLVTLASLRELEAENEPGWFAALLHTFVANAESRLKTMATATALADAETLHRAAHGLKGSSASFGATRLAALCAQLEKIAAGGTTDGALELLEQAQTEYRRVRQVLESEV